VAHAARSARASTAHPRRRLRQGHVGQGMDLMTNARALRSPSQARDFEATRRELLEQYRLQVGLPARGDRAHRGRARRAPAERIEAVAAATPRTFGVVFQIVDDIIDMPRAREAGKDHGEDLRKRPVEPAPPSTRSTRGRARARAPRPGARPRRRERELRMGARPGAPHWRRRALHRRGRRLIEEAWRAMRCVPSSDATIIMRSVPLWLIEQRRRKALEIARAVNGQATTNGKVGAAAPLIDGRARANGNARTDGPLGEAFRGAVLFALAGAGAAAAIGGRGVVDLEASAPGHAVAAGAARAIGAGSAPAEGGRTPVPGDRVAADRRASKRSSPSTSSPRDAACTSAGDDPRLRRDGAAPRPAAARAPLGFAFDGGRPAACCAPRIAG